MIRLLAAVAVIVLGLAPVTSRAAEKTVVVKVANANCTLCAPIVRASLARVAGVKQVRVAQASATVDPVATVTFDDAVTNVAALVAATTNAGYPSHPASAAR